MDVPGVTARYAARNAVAGKTSGCVRPCRTPAGHALGVRRQQCLRLPSGRKRTGRGRELRQECDKAGLLHDSTMPGLSRALFRDPRLSRCGARSKEAGCGFSHLGADARGGSKKRTHRIRRRPVSHRRNPRAQHLAIHGRQQGREHPRLREVRVIGTCRCRGKWSIRVKCNRDSKTLVAR